MLIARKLHSLVLIETVNFAWVRTFYRRHQSGIADGDAKAGGQSPASPWRWSRPMPGPHTRLQMINRHSGWWCARNAVVARNVAKRPGEETQGERNQGSATTDRPPDDGLGNRSLPHPHVGCSRPISRHRMQMRSWNGEQQPGLRCRGTRVETQAANVTQSPTPPPSMGNVQARHQMQLISQWSFLFPIEADSSGCITRVISAQRQKRLPLLPLPLRHATVLCFAMSVHLVCRPWLWWSKQAIDW